MLCGTKQSFAVEFELDHNYGGLWLYGKICYWINGFRVGDYQLGTSLRDVLLQMNYVLSDSGNRHGDFLCQLDQNEVFHRLDAAIYDDVASIQDSLDLPDTPARFDIREPLNIPPF